MHFKSHARMNIFPDMHNLVQDLVEEGILVSPRMMADHMPDYLTAVLRRMAHERASRDAHDGAADKPGRGGSQVRCRVLPQFSGKDCLLQPSLSWVRAAGCLVCFTCLYSVSSRWAGIVLICRDKSSV